jgi:hypothetical protein
VHVEGDDGFGRHEFLLGHAREELEGCGRRAEDFQHMDVAAKLRNFIERTMVRE